MPVAGPSPASSTLPHRHSWLLIGPDPWLNAQWQALAARSSSDGDRGLTSLCVTGSRQEDMPEPSCWTDCLPGRQLVRMLGRRYDRMVIDWRHGWQANQLSQVVGALGAGGQLVILLAEEDRWRERYAWHSTGALTYFPWWQQQMVQGGATVITPEAIAGFRSPASSRGPASRQPDDLSWLPPLPDPAPMASDLAEPATPGQAEVVTAISRLQSEVLVLTAERGFGKTLSLVLAARARAQRGETVLVTAALPDHLQEIRYWLAHWPAAEGLIHCLPWEQLTRPLLNDSCVMVDEAAALGLPRLRYLAQQASTLVLATTTAGYEGSGLGFLLRFLPWLEQRRSVIARSLDQPVRWAPGDPVAQQVRHSLLSPRASLATPSGTPGVAQPLDLAATLNTPTQRDQWVRLLAESHYQTRPDDLRQCLDNPSARAWGVFCGDTLAGLLVLLEEPPLSAPLGEAVWRGTRRPPDQLAKQSILGQQGHRDAMDWHGARIWRLVVHPACRRQGIATSLVTEVATTVQAQGMDYLATAFGLTTDLLAFWQQQRFWPVRLGHQLDPASGSQSLLAVQPLSATEDRVETWCRSAAMALGEQWLLHTDQARQLNDPELLTALAATLPPPVLTESVKERLTHWAHSHQPESAGRHWLALGLWHWVYHNRQALPVSARMDQAQTTEVEAWSHRLWRDRPWSEVQAELGIADRKAVQRALRQALAAVVAQSPPI